MPKLMEVLEFLDNSGNSLTTCGNHCVKFYKGQVVKNCSGSDYLSVNNNNTTVEEYISN